MKAAIYCRLSKEDESKTGESESIQNQKSMLIQYAMEQGFELYQIYSDEDYSGIDRNRPAFKEMIRAASEHKFDVVLAKTQSRFTRDMELVEKYLHGKFIEWGIRFIAVVDHVDTDDTANKKSRQINGLINEWYLEDLSVNVRSVLDHKRKEGQYIASFALYGYQKDLAAKGKLQIDPEAAEVVRRIYAMTLRGVGAHKIAQILNGEGVPSPTAYKQQNGERYHLAQKTPCESLWSSGTVYQMLHNQTYAGDLVQGRHKKVSYKSKRTVWLPKSQWIVVENTHEAIIDKDTYDRIKLAIDNDETGQRETHVLNEPGNQAKWGVLQYYEKLDGDSSAALLTQRAKTLLKYYNKKHRTLTIKKAFGDPRVRGGSLLVVRLGLGDISVQNYMCVEKVTHTWAAGVHTMDLNLSGIRGEFVT